MRMTRLPGVSVRVMQGCSNQNNQAYLKLVLLKLYASLRSRAWKGQPLRRVEEMQRNAHKPVRAAPSAIGRLQSASLLSRSPPPPLRLLYVYCPGGFVQHNVCGWIGDSACVCDACVSR